MSKIKDNFNLNEIYNVIPKNILKEILNEYQLDLLNGMNGLNHWSRIIENAFLLSEYNKANKKVLVAFAFFHKIKRNNEEQDTNEGYKGAQLLRYYENELGLNEEEFDQAYFACVNFNEFKTHDNLTIATCWDAERLDLMRTGLYPREDDLQSTYAKNAGTITWAVRRALNNHISDWVYEMLEEIGINY